MIRTIKKDLRLMPDVCASCVIFIANNVTLAAFIVERADGKSLILGKLPCTHHRRNSKTLFQWSRAWCFRTFGNSYWPERCLHKRKFKMLIYDTVCVLDMTRRRFSSPYLKRMRHFHCDGVRKVLKNFREYPPGRLTEKSYLWLIRGGPDVGD